MIGATALGDITDEARIIGETSIFQVVKGALLFGVIGVSSIYGMYQYDIIVGPGNVTFRNNITNFTEIFAIAIFFTSTLTEIFVAKLRA